MKKFNLLVLLLFIVVPILQAQDFTRTVIDVPMADPGAVTIDGNLNDAAWEGAAKIDLVTSEGFNIFINSYDREATEPEYDEYYARLLWTQDTLYVGIHIDEVVNDSTGLYWAGQWLGDQLFVSLSNRFGLEMVGNYDGNVYTAPDGPYHYLILGDEVSLNAGQETWVPEEYRGCEADSQKVFMASDFARWGITINEETGVWDLELAIYNPNVSSQSGISFNLGGSQGSEAHDVSAGDAYAYYTWQPNTPNDPFFAPLGESDAGMYNLINSEYWALLNFTGGEDKRLELNVPMADPGAVTIDGNLNDAAWEDAAKIDLVTSEGFNIFINSYDREATEPEYDEYFARLLWTKDTLYVGIHIDEVVNDSTGLYWAGQWLGDQLFVSLSNRFGLEMVGNYDGNVYTAPDGPYHYLILGDEVSLNAGQETWVPEEYRTCLDQSDSQKVFMASDFARWGITINEETGVWDLELAIYHPHANYDAKISFNLGGSQGSEAHDVSAGDAYAYYTWQPNTPNDPFFAPLGESDAGMYNLINSEYWAVLNLVTSLVGVREEPAPNGIPTQFSLMQNYPNPFNPSTTIRFEVAERSDVSLKIYNIVGQEVAALINNQVMEAGVYSASFDARNLASGVYFYELKAGDVSISKKMVLLK